jgi:hypothetical protein
MSVLNRQDDSIGSVEDLVVELRSGRVIAVVVSSGGFLGVGDALNAVPPGALELAEDRDTLRLDMTKEALLAAPRFKSSEWPDFSERKTTDGMNRAYQSGAMAYNRNNNRPVHADNTDRTTRDRDDRMMTPGDQMNRNSDRGVEADNAARNMRDRDDRTLTPSDQGGSDSDVAITQRIRQAVVAHDDLSVNAQNVKIITVDGRVTLRGPVASAAERKMIGDIAARIAARIDNQLEVTTR